MPTDWLACKREVFFQIELEICNVKFKARYKFSALSRQRLAPCRSLAANGMAIFFWASDKIRRLGAALAATLTAWLKLPGQAPGSAGVSCGRVGDIGPTVSISRLESQPTPAGCCNLGLSVSHKSVSRPGCWLVPPSQWWPVSMPNRRQPDSP